jgi:mannitol/fructose-specific phosphotransferase system IIA component (Ntr-type)
LGATANDWEQVVEIAGQLLLETNAIHSRYIEAMKEAIWQYGPYVVFTPGVALLHARPEDGVNRICLSLVTLDPPVPFGHAYNDPVSLAIVLGAIDNHSHLKALAQLANLLSDPHKIEQIRTATSKAGVIRILSQDA